MISTYNRAMTDGSRDGYYHDPASTIWEPVNGQGRSEYAGIAFGWNNLGDVGCGAIAVHNTMCLIGKGKSLRSVLEYFSPSREGVLRPFGVMPWEIGDYLNYNGINYQESNNSAIIEKIQSGGVVIVTFWNEMSGISYSNSLASIQSPNIFKGAHTVAITYRNGKYFVYNAFNDSTEPRAYSDINYYLKGGFIYGYYIPA